MFFSMCEREYKENIRKRANDGNTKNFEEERTKKSENLKEAVEYVKSYDKSMRNNPTVNVHNIAKRIKKSYNTKKQYNFYYWKFEVK